MKTTQILGRGNFAITGIGFHFLTSFYNLNMYFTQFFALPHKLVKKINISTPVCVIVAPLAVIFTYFLFDVKNYLDIAEMRPTRRWKAFMLYFTILISFK